MNKNKEFNISELPKVSIQRSIFPFKFGHKTSFNTGEVIPFLVEEILPGSTYSLNTSCVVRLQTLLTPIMDNMYADTSYWFVPNRLVMDHWKNLMGENEEGPWTMDKIEYQIPHLTYPVASSDEGQVDTTHGFDSGSIADYMGVPININSEDFGQNMVNKDFPMALPFRAYAKIINEFWRDQNLQRPIVVHTDEVVRAGVTRAHGENDPDWYVSDLELGGKPFVAARLHDYFSSLLPAPQKGPDVSIFGTFANSTLIDNNFASGPFAPVYSRSDSVYGARSGLSVSNLVPFKVFDTTNGTIPVSNKLISQALVDTEYNTIGFTGNQPNVNGIVPMNLWANLNVPEATISNLRMAFQLQKYYEKLARGGSRYREYLMEFFGVTNGDARMQVPEYLGGHRFPLAIHQVANQSQSDGNALGDLGAMSNTSDVHSDVHMSFSEHGFLIGLICVRYDNTYSQGLERFWSRRSALDFYNPVFAHISDQPVFKRELSLGVPSEFTDGFVPVPQPANAVFGYGPAWNEYRLKPSRVSGEMRPEAVNSLASWHLADDYEVAPTLGADWIQMDKNIVDRVLSVTSDVSNQIFCDIFVSGKKVLPMPVHGIPGLADHF